MRHLIKSLGDIFPLFRFKMIFCISFNIVKQLELFSVRGGVFEIIENNEVKVIQNDSLGGVKIVKSKINGLV